mmetsp:Transcript_25973/g.64906  ORF Transcript_25973/g.64906 Transcript_25973/m.64906 type:complete len:660 (-) Transcript_25973:627-2606(-)
MILPEEDGSCFRIAVVGAGPVGLSFAIATSDLLRRSEPSLPFFIDVFERRIVRANPTAPFVWQDVNRPDRPETERNARRQQVVTIQSTVFAALPPVIQESIEPRAEKVWPLTDDSPKELGHPLNVRIRDIEDVLLAVAQDTPNVRVHLSAGPSAFSDESAAAIRAVAGRVHMLVGADGRGSHVFETFKKPTHGVLGFRRENLDVAGDEVLGVLVRQPPAESEEAARDRQRLAVITTLVQSRYLLNAREIPREGRVGFLNMRLATSEARYAHGGGGPDGTGQACNQAVPCRLWSMHNPAGDNTGVNCVASCSHGGVFYPSAKDAPPEAAAVLERLLDGAALYGIPRSALTDIVRFRLDVTEQTRFILAAPPSPLNSPSAVMPKFGTWKRPLVSLVGDAAIPVHFWPGRGLNTGLRCAIALAITTVEAAVRAFRRNPSGDIEGPLQKWSSYMKDMSQREQYERSVGAQQHAPRGTRSAHAATLGSSERSVVDVFDEVIANSNSPGARLAEEAVKVAKLLGDKRYKFEAGGKPDDVRHVLLDCISKLKNRVTLSLLWEGGRAHPPAISIDADHELSVYEALLKIRLVENSNDGKPPTLVSTVLVNNFCEFLCFPRPFKTPKWIFKYLGASAAAAEEATISTGLKISGHVWRATTKPPSHSFT